MTQARCVAEALHALAMDHFGGGSGIKGKAAVLTPYGRQVKTKSPTTPKHLLQSPHYSRQRPDAPRAEIPRFLKFSEPTIIRIDPDTLRVPREIPHIRHLRVKGLKIGYEEQ